MSLENSLDSSFGRRGEPHDISAPGSTEETYERLVRKQKFSQLLPLNIQISPDSLTSFPSVEEVPLVCWARDETSSIRRY